ncbi:MAG: transposase [Chloroflexi bacterium]|nr:MAG: transposase [Chloroflexota bacterium]
MHVKGRLPTRKPIRLVRQVYEGNQAYSVTVGTARRAASFGDEDVVTIGRNALSEAAGRHGVDVLAYCFMPDHFHLLVEGRDGSNLIDFMKLFKQLAGYRYKTMFGRSLWQKGYHDHVLRREEDIGAVARYIFANPVRAELVEAMEDYPYSGGILFSEVSGDLPPRPAPRPEGRPYEDGSHA